MGAIGWFVALAGQPEPPAPEPEGMQPTPAQSATPVDEAMAAIAAEVGSGVIRCALADLDGDVRWPFVAADLRDGVLRAVPPSPDGRRRISGRQEGTVNAEDVLAGEGPPPRGVLVWEGAAPGRVGGCRLDRTEAHVVRGRVEGASGNVAVQVCGERVLTAEDGSFAAPAWTGERCLVYIAEPGWTQALHALTVGEGPAPVLTVTRTDRPPDRRVVVRGELPASRALKAAALSPAARAVLEGWSRDGLRARADRDALDRAADAP